MNKKLITIATGFFFSDRLRPGKCSSRSQAAKILTDTSIANMIPVQGGEFLMGDFGPLVDEKLPFSIQQDDKTLQISGEPSQALLLSCLGSPL